MTIRTLACGILLAATTSVWSPPAHADAVEPKVTTTSIKVELEKVQGSAGLVIFSVAPHGD